MRKDPSGDFGRKLNLRSNVKEIECISAGSAVGMAMMESIGIPEIIDENTTWDRSQRALSPGKAIKAICGTMFTSNLKRSLLGISEFYEYSPVDMLFGPMVDLQALNDVSLGRAMDTVFDADVEILYYTIAARAKATFEIMSKTYHLDGSDITITRDPNNEYPEETENLRPMLGHPKDGHNDRLKYNFECVADDNGIPVYFKTHSGNYTDNQMDMDALNVLKDVMCDERIVAVADCKLVDENTVNMLIWNGIPFVSKCPENFAEKVKQKIIDKAMETGFTKIGRIGKRKDAPEYEICDIDEITNGEKLRFVAYRECNLAHSLKYYRDKVGRDIGKKVAILEKKVFACENDVLLEIERAEKMFGDVPYDFVYRAVMKTYPGKRSKKGRPPKDEPEPEDIVKWHLVCEYSFNEIRATEMAKRRDIRVIVTSLPRSDVTCEILADGATGEDVMRTYLGQWRIENIFSEMKSKLGADKVFFETPKREAVMLFSIALAVLVRRLIQMQIREKHGRWIGVPENLTANHMFVMMQNTDVRVDRDAGDMYFDGPSLKKDFLMSILKILEIEPSDLVG